MKKLITLILFMLYGTYSNGQTWIAGDTVGYVKTDVSAQLLPNSKVSFDIDCDGLEDLNINSVGPVDISKPWSRLSFEMTEDVKCIMIEPGFIAVFHSGDTIDLSEESIYEENLDYICGNGEGGGYGRCNIREKYFVFRKTSPIDTNYLYMLFSNFNIDFTIHHVIAGCANNPIAIVTDLNEVEEEDEIMIMPNPAQSIIYMSKVVEEAIIYSMNGKVVLNGGTTCEQLDISQINKGMYILVFDYNAEKKMLKLIKK